MPERDFVIAGPNLPSNFDLGRVKYLGIIQDTAELFNGAAALIYPERFGTGIKTKILEAWSYKVPVIGLKNAFTNLECDEHSGAIVIQSLEDLIHVGSYDHLRKCSVGIDILYLRYSKNQVYSKFIKMVS